MVVFGKVQAAPKNFGKILCDHAHTTKINKDRKLIMPCSYRITKYTETNEECFLTSPPEEWTSFHEIDTPEKEKDYAEIENRYLNAIRTISECINITHYKISELEPHVSEKFFEGQEINTSGIENIASQVLRENLVQTNFSKR